MRSVLLAQLRTHAARLVASTLAIVIAVAFVVATLVLNETTRSTVLQTVGARYVDTAAVVVGSDGAPLTDALATVAGLPTVGAVAPTWSASVQTTVPGLPGSRFLLVDAVADDPALRWQQLAAGSLPDAAGEVAVSRQVRAALGDVLTVTGLGAEGTSVEAEVVVTGIVDLGADPEAGLYGRAFATVDQTRTWGAGEPTELRIAAAPGASDEEVRTDVTAALAGSPVEVRTGTEQAEAAAAELMGNATALAAVLLVFGTVAVLVAGLVIANTFAVLLAQRTRELALLRCVGATARQVRRSVLGEALATGLVASALGVLAGIGLAAGVSAVAGRAQTAIPLSGLAVPAWAPVAGLLLGTTVTVVAALAPARAATRVAPLAALRPVDQAPLRSRPGMVRLALGLLLVLPGTALMAAGVLRGDVLVALPGGALSFLGVVLLAQRGVPPVVAAAGRLAGRLGGVPAQLASGNATRNPRRTAATATALLIGVTLTSAMVVGAATTKATANAELHAQFPADVVVESYTGELSPTLVGALTSADGVAHAAQLLGADVTGPDGQPAYAFGGNPADLRATLRSTGALAVPAAGDAVVPEWLAASWRVGEGGTVTLAGPDGAERQFTVQLTDDDQPLLLSAADLRALAPAATPAQVWLRLSGTEGAGQTDTVDRLTDLTAAQSGSAQVTGIVTMRDQVARILDALLLVVTGLLGVAVVIALIGVGNTLALSVVERRQENGLLRALGLTRRQLRGLLAWEAVLVAGVAAALGVFLGAGYGLIGAASVLGDAADRTVLSVPWLQVAVIVLVATGAGLLASVLPARRAARTSPVAAIAG